MGKVVAMRHLRQSRNRDISQNVKQDTLFQQALDKIKAQNGIDYYKILSGDEKEKQRLKMLEYQETLLEE